MPDSTQPEGVNLFGGLPEEYVAIAMEKVSQRFQFCDLEDPMVQSIYMMSVAREAQNLQKGEALPW